VTVLGPKMQIALFKAMDRGRHGTLDPPRQGSWMLEFFLRTEMSIERPVRQATTGRRWLRRRTLYALARELFKRAFPPHQDCSAHLFLRTYFGVSPNRLCRLNW
jgi:hypothetical protein